MGALRTLLLAATLAAACERGAATCTVKFAVSSTARNYADSIKYCRSIGMTIASIHSAAENSAVKSMIKKVSYLGATEIKQGGNTANNWKWDDGSKWDFLASNDGLKSGGESRIAFSTGNPQWHDWCARPTSPLPCRVAGTIIVTALPVPQPRRPPL